MSPDPNSAAYNTNITPTECLQGFCIGLYQEALNLLANFINRAFKPTQANSNQAVANSMLIIDPPGFQYQKSGALGSYSDLLCNYISERLQLLFFQINFINPIEKCAQEGLDIDLVEHIPESPSALVNWFDKPPAPTSILYRANNSNTNIMGSPSIQSDSSNCGLLWLLEEQMYSENRSAKGFLRKLAESDPKQNFTSASSSESGAGFFIHHQYGQFPIEYSVDEWLEKYNKEFLTQRNALFLLQDSRKEAIASAFQASSAISSAAASLNTPAGASYMSSANAAAFGLDNAGGTSLKRQASVRKMLTLSKRKTFTINFKLQIDSVFDSMRRTKCNFVFCFRPTEQQALANSVSNAEQLDLPLIRGQLKAYQILAACRIYRQGYPEFLNFEEFERRFSMFLTDSGSNNVSISNDDHRQACLNLIRSFDLDAAHYKLGTTQVSFFFRVYNFIVHFVRKLKCFNIASTFYFYQYTQF